MIKQVRFSNEFYCVSILGNEAPLFTFKTRRTEADHGSIEDFKHEIAKHQAALDEIKTQVMEAVRAAREKIQGDAPEKCKGAQ